MFYIKKFRTFNKLDFKSSECWHFFPKSKTEAAAKEIAKSKKDDLPEAFGVDAPRPPRREREPHEQRAPRQEKVDRAGGGGGSGGDSEPKTCRGSDGLLAR